MKNRQIATILKEIGEFLEAKEVEFKPRAYKSAARAVKDSSKQVKEIYEEGGIEALKKIPQVGQSIAEKIREIIEKGECEYHQKLKKETPIKMDEIVQIEGVGPKTALKLYKNIGTKNISEIEEAAKNKKIRELKGFGKKSEQNILRAIKFLKKSRERFILGFTMPEIKEIISQLRKLNETQKVKLAGSARRRKETIGDIDILIISEKRGSVMDYIIGMPKVSHVHGKGETKTSVKLDSGIDMDIRIVEKNSWGAALNYFTGSKAHNVKLREKATENKWKLNEYGLFDKEEEKKIAGKSEKGIYKKLNMEYIPPELRENNGEIEAAQQKNLPKLVDYGQLKGDLQIQTNWSDGKHSIEEMAQKAIQMNLEYIAITDHTKSLGMAGGLNSKELTEQWKEIEKVKDKVKNKNLRIMKSTECDILKDGSLDLPASTLKKLDIVGIAIHSNFNLSKKRQTKRIIKAIKNPYSDILFHPTGRKIHKRRPYEINLKKIIKAARKTGTVLEINAFPDRLDLKDKHIRKCVKSGVKLSISSDAHHKNHMNYLEYGVAQARRGWAEKSDIINTKNYSKLSSFLQK